MAQHIEREGLHILRRNVTPAVQEGPGLGRHCERDGGARRSAVADVAVQVNAVMLGIARRQDRIDDVILELVIHIDRVNHATGGQDVVRRHDGRDPQIGFTGGHSFEDGAFLRAVGIVHNDLEHEAVNLGFGQRVGALLFERILGRHDQEGLRQRVGIIAQGHLAFLHRFQQGTLDLGRGAVDFVRQDEVAENGAVLGVETALARVVNHGANDVRRQHVGRELQAVELQLGGRGERLERESLGQPRNAFEQDVPIGDQAHEQPVHEVLLAHQHARNLLAQRRNPAGSSAHRFVDGLDALVRPAGNAVAAVPVLRDRQRLGPDRCYGTAHGGAAETKGFQLVFGDGSRRGVAPQGPVGLRPAGVHTCLLVPVRMVHSVNYFVVVSVIDSRSDYCYKRPPRDCWNLSRQLHF